MNLLKICGIILTILSAVFVNISYIKRIKIKTEALKEVYLMIDYIEISIKYQNSDIDKIFENIVNSQKYAYLPFLADFNNMVDRDFSKYDFNSGKNNRVFERNARNLLKGFFSILGKSDADGQISNCKTYKDFFLREISKYEQSEEKKIKSATSLILGLILITVIMII